jgi:hypothetical protein
MKISIGTNIFGSDLKQSLGLETQYRLKNKYPDIVNLYAFQRKIEENISSLHETKLLTRDSRDFVEGGKKTTPCVKDILDGLAETDCDYMVYTNSDILFSYNFIEYILNGDYTGYACSRMDIHPINNLQDKMIQFRYEIAGQDTFVIKKDWYIKKRHVIKDYLIGSILYDTALTCILKQHGQNDPIVNDYPVQIAHIHHGWGSGYPSPENTYNTSLYDSEDKQLKDPWGWYYHNVLTKRPDGFNMFTLFPNEKQIEKEHFGKFIYEN